MHSQMIVREEPKPLGLSRGQRDVQERIARSWMTARPYLFYAGQRAGKDTLVCDQALGWGNDKIICVAPTEAQAEQIKIMLEQMAGSGRYHAGRVCVSWLSLLELYLEIDKWVRAGDRLSISSPFFGATWLISGLGWTRQATEGKPMLADTWVHRREFQGEPIEHALRLIKKHGAGNLVAYGTPGDDKMLVNATIDRWATWELHPGFKASDTLFTRAYAADQAKAWRDFGCLKPEFYTLPVPAHA